MSENYYISYSVHSWQNIYTNYLIVSLLPAKSSSLLRDKKRSLTLNNSLLRIQPATSNRSRITLLAEFPWQKVLNTDNILTYNADVAQCYVYICWRDTVVQESARGLSDQQVLLLAFWLSLCLKMGKKVWKVLFEIRSNPTLMDTCLMCTPHYYIA